MINIQDLVEARDVMNERLKAVQYSLADTTIDLDVRWDTFVDLIERNILVNIESYGDGFLYEIYPSASLYDDFYLDRHQTLTYDSMYERLQDKTEANEQSWSKEKLTEWREAVLASGYSGFNNDW